MMRLIMFTAAVLFFGVVLPQENTIVVENKVWSVVQENCLPEGNVYTTIYQRFEGDTVINNLIYKKVLVAEDELHQEWYYSGSFIREENGKVYLKEFYGDEGLIYDFNLLPGDTVTINNPLAPDGLLLTLTEIDSVETFDGYRTRWKLEKDQLSPPEYWIEGIGSESGVLNSGTGVFGPLCGAFTLLCEKENDITIYQNPEYETCFYILLDIDENLSGTSPIFTITRQPGGASMNIEFDDRQLRLIKVTSITGQTVFVSESNEQTIRIPVSIFSSGLYIVSAIRSGQHYSQKLLFN